MESKFDKVFNMIMQGVITQDIQSKTKKAIQTFIKSGQLKDQNDPKVKQIREIIKRNAKVDVNNKTKLDQFLKQNQKYVNRGKATDTEWIESFKELTKQKSESGIVIYKVADTKEGQAAIRKIVTAQLGDKANPWTLIEQRGDGLTEHSWVIWQVYNKAPKRVAFQNGKIFAFGCKSEYDKEYGWWDLQDRKYYKLPLPNGKEIDITFKD